jgi:CheY-like chemotaxis protein
MSLRALAEWLGVLWGAILHTRPFQKEVCATMGGRVRREFQGTVLIADDHAVFRLGLVQLLRRSLKVKRFLEAECFAQVVEHLKDRDVSLTILDLGMQGFAGPQEITRMRLLRPDAQVVVLSGSDSRKDILEALSAGAHGYIVKGRETSACPVGRNLCACSFGRPPTRARRSDGVGPRGAARTEDSIQPAARGSQRARRRQVQQGNCARAECC